MISDIKMYPDMTVQNVLTVVRAGELFDYDSKTATEVLRLGDASGSIEAVIAENSTLCQGVWPVGSRIKVAGVIQAWRGRMVLSLRQAEIDHDELSLSLIPVDWLSGEDRYQLESLISELKSAPLREFMMRIFADREIAEKFFRVGASQKHHHQERGGLIRHSLECALTVSASATGSRVEKEMGIVAALLHDIGKIWTQEDRSTRTELGILVPHYQLTLEILAKHLRWLQLQLQEPSLANGIRYLLTQGQVAAASNKHFPVMPVATLIRSADRYSAARDVERRAYANRSPHYASFSVGTGPQNDFWRAAI